jgi:hypothetical protein
MVTSIKIGYILLSKIILIFLIFKKKFSVIIRDSNMFINYIILL